MNGTKACCDALLTRMWERLVGEYPALTPTEDEFVLAVERQRAVVRERDLEEVNEGVAHYLASQRECP
jgi:hypothetical protein